MPKKDPISDEDKALFRDSVRGTRRMKSDKVTPSRLQQRQDRRTMLNRHRMAEEEAEDYPDWSDGYEEDWVDAEYQFEFAKSGVDDRTLRRLKAGKFPVHARLDLHGVTSEQAKVALFQFLGQQSVAHRRCVCIIHGKGRTGAKPVLKNKINRWLQQSEVVAAFSSAPPAFGGTGAVLVLIKGK